MIAKYNGKYYCAMNYGPEVNIWRYPVEKLDIKEGYVLPNEELTVKLEEIEEIFYPVFQVIWNEHKCSVTMPIDHSYITLIVGETDKEFAELHNFEINEIEDYEDYKYYTKNVSVEEVTEYIFSKTLLLPRKDNSNSFFPYDSENITAHMEKDEWLALYHEMDIKPYWTEMEE